MNQKIKQNPLLFIVLGILVTLGVLCSAILIKSKQNKPPIDSLPPTPTEVIVNPNTEYTKESEEYVKNLAVVDLSKTEDINKKNIEVVSIEKKEWADSSLGCTKPGAFYTQVITPGYVITLIGNENEFIYHTSLNRVIRCN